MKKDNQIRTYDSICLKIFQQYKKKNWEKKSNFPLDWSGRHPLNFNKKNNSKYFKDYAEFAELGLFYKSNFYLVVNEKKDIKININGLNQNESSVKYKNITNDSNNTKINFKKKFSLKEGIINLKLMQLWKVVTGVMKFFLLKMIN